MTPPVTVRGAGLRCRSPTRGDAYEIRLFGIINEIIQENEQRRRKGRRVMRAALKQTASDWSKKQLAQEIQKE
jgi:hypothetical protein